MEVSSISVSIIILQGGYLMKKCCGLLERFHVDHDRKPGPCGIHLAWRAVKPSK